LRNPGVGELLTEPHVLGLEHRDPLVTFRVSFSIFTGWVLDIAASVPGRAVVVRANSWRTQSRLASSTAGAGS